MHTSSIATAALLLLTSHLFCAEIRRAEPVDDPPAAKKNVTKKSTDEDAEAAVKPMAVTDSEPAKEDMETCLRVQIFLDQNNFGPGKLDAAIGEFTRKAALIYNEVHGHDPGDWKPIIEAATEDVKTVYAAHRLQENDFRFLVPKLPTSPKLQAAFKYMGYRSMEEFIAERYHTSESFLQKLNPDVSINSLKAGATVVVPNVNNPFIIEEVPYSQKYENDAELSARSIIIDTKSRVATFYNGEGKLFASFPITPGQEKFIHYGEWEITNMVTTPNFRWDKSMLEEGQRSDSFYQLPPGPNNPVGIFWASTSRSGIGLHGTSTPHTIGRSESHGCVRFANWDAVRLPGIVRPGAKVTLK